MEKIKFAIIGCGRISFKHVEGIINNSTEAELVATCDLHIERAREKAEKYENEIGLKNCIKVYTDYREMINDSDIDVVTVATESGYHAEIAIECMKHGKHVIVEKPMALSTEDAENMIECARNSNVKICVSHQNRFNPSIQQLRKAVESNRFGRIVNGTARILWNRNMEYYNQATWRGTWRLDGGTLMNQCIHNVDLLQWMLGGEVETVFSQSDTFLRDIEAEDFGVILLRFKNGAIGVVEGSACVYPNNLKETLDLFGEKGTVSIGGIAVNNIEVWKFADNDDNQDTITSNLKERIDSVYGFGHTPLFKDMIDAIKNHREPLINGEEGKRAMDIILAAYKSRLTGQPVVFPIEKFSTTEMEINKGKY